VASKAEEIDSKIASAVASIDQKVTNATSNLGDYATKSSLATTDSRLIATESGLAELSSKITDLETLLASTKSELTAKIGEDNSEDIDELWDELDDLTTQLEELEEEVAEIETSSSSSEPDIEIEDWGNTGFVLDGYNLKNTYKLTIENNTNSDIAVTELWVLIQPETMTGSITGVQMISTRGSVIWAPVSSKTLQFYSIRDIEIDKNDYETLYLEATVLYSLNDGVVSGGTVDVELEDWEKL